MIAMPPITQIPSATETKYEPAYGDVWYWWRNLRYMLREQIYVGLIAFLAISVVVMGLYVSATRVYKSEASFLVDQSPFQFSVNQGDAEGSRLLLQSIISSITSFDMQDIIAERLQVPSKNVCIIGLGPKALGLKSPDEVNISVTTERGSRLVTVEAQSSNAEFATKAANAVLDEVLGLNRLAGRLNDVNEQILTAQAEVNQYAQNVSAADANRAQLQQEVLGIDRHIKMGGSLETAPAFVQDQGLIDLQKKRIDADSAYSAQTQVSVQGPQLRALAGAKTSVDLQIQDYLHNKAIGVHSAYNDAEARVASLNLDLQQKVEALNALQREKTQLSDAVGDFKLRRELGLFKPDAKANEASVVVVLDRARAAWKPAKPMLALYLAAGLGLALVLCPGLMFFRHNMDRTIKYPQQIEVASGVPCLAVIPRQTQKNLAAKPYIPGREIVSGLSYLRNRLLRGSSMGYDNHIVSFMDLGTSESSVDSVAQLGWLLANSGKPTLLIDLDFKNPRLAKLLQLPEEHGLSEWVASEGPLSEYIQKSEVTEIGLLQPGKSLRDLDVQLARRHLAHELEKLRQTWQYILIYAPSLLENPHLLLAAPSDSPIISLVEYGNATLDDLNEAVALSESFNFRFGGVILHHFPVPVRRPGKSRYIFGLGPHRYVFDQALKPT